MNEPKYKKGESVYLAIPEYYTVENVDACFKDSSLGDQIYVYRLRGLDNDLIYVEEEKMEEYKV